MHRAIGEMAQAVAFALHHAPTGMAQAGVKTDDAHLPSDSCLGYALNRASASSEISKLA